MYGFSTTVNGRFDEVVQQVTEALRQEGFGVLSEIDVAGTLHQRLGVDKRPYKILGACNPQLANQAIDAEPDIGMLLPCNVIVREEDEGRMRVGFMDPKAVLQLVDRPELADLGADVRERLERVRASLES